MIKEILKALFFGVVGLAIVLSVMLIAHRAYGQPFPRSHEDGDIVELQDSTEGQVAQVYYSNAGGLVSEAVTTHLEFTNQYGEHVRVKITVEIGSKSEDYAEKLTVEVLLPEEHIAYPPEVWVLDGYSTTVQILRPMF